MAMRSQADTVLTGKQIGVIALICISGCIIVPNTALSLYACFVLLVILKYLWLRYQPAIFLFSLLFQWAQASLRIFQANAANEQLARFDGSANAPVAAFAALTTTLIVALIFAKFLKSNQWDGNRLQQHLSLIHIKKVFLIHFIMFAGMPLLSLAKIGGLSQIIVSLESLKWLAFTILSMSVYVQRRLFPLLIISFFGELVLGFTGYFSGFKTVVFFSVIALLSVTPAITFGRLLVTAILTTLVLALGLFWTSIKGDYRNFLSGGRRAQIVTVSTTESLEFIYSSISSANRTPVENSVDALLNRIQYTRMIQLVMDYVPQHLEHQQGKQWKDAVNHILQPRILFPDKLPLDDSAITAKYTGMRWAGAQEGTSISIGYVAESYVDYGIPGMFLPVAVLAVFIGYLYRTMVRIGSKYDLLFYTASIVLFFRFSHIETSYTKILGGIITTYLVYMLAIRWAIFPLFWRFITSKGNP